MAEVLETVRRRSAASIAALLLVAGCEREASSIAVSGATGGAGGKLPVELVCPARPPTNAAACNSTLFCEYPAPPCPNQTASTVASCVNGRWLIGQGALSICETANQPMPLPCPGLPPATGEVCPIGTFTTRANTEFDAFPVTSTDQARYVFISPEARAGVRFAKHFEASAGIRALLLIAPTQPRWDDQIELDASTDGAGTYPAETLAGSFMVILSPGLSARYDF